MKKIHLKYSLVVLCFILITLISSIFRQEASQLFKEQTSTFVEQKEASGQAYRYGLNVFKLFNAR